MALKVSELNKKISHLFDAHFDDISVQGEVSRVTYHSSGHVYFTLKDEFSSISCVFFKSYVQKSTIRLAQGMQIVLSGKLNCYIPNGTYSINVYSFVMDGLGALKKMFDELKQELESKGLFENKKKLPLIPKDIILITSITGAALQDMKSVAQKRFPLVRLHVLDTLMQGASAKDSIVESLKLADSLKYDIIVLARGGGSIEDLWCFNEKDVAYAIAKCKTPVVSAIGHEIDYSISDYVSDLRAPTPSAAMELILPEASSLKSVLNSKLSSLSHTFKNILLQKLMLLNALDSKLSTLSPKSKLDAQTSLLASKKERLGYIMQDLLNSKEKILELLSTKLSALNPESRELKGLVELSKDGKVIDLRELKKDDVVELSTIEVSKVAKILF
ncbi:exodeoxyribonuclease VII large subunit [Helicobacter sp. 11S02629-2]|uniref:exodeoxyribonuclease VII large subunit n=1 Tax=Helicobacter sp. 11S02629-2 TaxID=1476195 RepID=UPI000BC9B282|nr:exodeoxyribonuclease VII large subunit [Helicobacter sp. 11S02629-2]PAF46046.1 exodeoxyribonuclease VII large subunit [Helicobacter sp. 11S02629-2]